MSDLMEGKGKTASRWRAMAAALWFVACSPAWAQSGPLTERAVTFRNGPVELHGTLMLPAQKPAPAVVFLHGSGPHARKGFRPYAEEFARLGLASLFFDKRGTGESGGSWITSSLQDLAGDAIAAVNYMKTVEEVDARSIGFWGVSQAGWVAPLAASQCPDIAFMILISGGGATPRESEMFSYERQFERSGLPASEKAQAAAVLDSYFSYLADGEGREALAARLDALRGGPLNQLAEQLSRILPSQANRTHWSWVATYDPAPLIAGLKIPVLLLFGDQDTDHPTELAIERWRQGLAKAGESRGSIVVFPGAGHGIRMRMAGSGGGHAGGGRAPFADGYHEVQLGWLWRHVVAPRQK